jgi:hypothetical protein
VNVTAYLETLAGLGIGRDNLPPLQPLFQHRVWERFEPGEGPGRLATVIGELSAEDTRFHMEGGSWTSDISWVCGYDNVLTPMDRASTLFNEHLLSPGIPASDPRYRRACFICWLARPAATATGGGASGPTTAPSWPAAPARRPARQADPGGRGEEPRCEVELAEVTTGGQAWWTLGSRRPAPPASCAQNSRPPLRSCSPRPARWHGTGDRSLPVLRPVAHLRPGSQRHRHLKLSRAGVLPTTAARHRCRRTSAPTGTRVTVFAEG